MRATKKRTLIGALVALGTLAGCGDDSLPAVPDRMERETPAMVAPGAVTEFWDAGPEDIIMGTPVECCDVRFALRADTTLDEVAARLVGPGAPLDARVAMSREGDVWSASACMPITYGASYRYEVDVLGDDGTSVLTVVRTNPNAPLGASSLYDAVNVFEVVSDCEGDFSRHGDTSEAVEL